MGNPGLCLEDGSGVYLQEFRDFRFFRPASGNDDDVGDRGVGGVHRGGDGGVEQADRGGRKGDFFGSDGGSVEDRRRQGFRG